MEEKQAPIQPYSKKQLAALYDGITLATLRSWLKPFKKEIGEYKGKAYTINQVQIIFEKIGRPYV